MAFVEASGARLYVEETGQGDPVVFVYELYSDCREWEAQVRWFSRSYRCVTFNARGYPPSDVPKDPNLYGYQFAVDDIAAVLRGSGISKAHIVGLSMGAYAALLFTLKYPEMASAVVAAATGSGSPSGDRAEFVANAEASAKAYLEQGSAAVAESVGVGPTRRQLQRKDPRGFDDFMRHLREHSAEGMAHTLRQFQAKRPALHDFAADFARLQIPVLLIAGDEDAPCLETSLFLKKTIPDAGLWICPHTGHGINLEEPAAFNSMVQNFLSAVAPASAG